MADAGSQMTLAHCLRLNSKYFRYFYSSVKKMPRRLRLTTRHLIKFANHGKGANISHCLSKDHMFKSRFQPISYNLSFKRNYSAIFHDVAKFTKKDFSIEKYLKLPIKGASANSENDILEINFGGDVTLDYPVVWLRDNCRCSRCFEPVSKSRIIDQQSFREDVSLKSVTTTEDFLSITWDDGHESEFSKEWLCNHSFVREHQSQRVDKRHIRQRTWKANEFFGTPACQTFSFNDIINDDLTLLRWMESLATYGVAHISGTPPASGQVERIANRVAFLRKTHYGGEFYVRGDPNSSNVAYRTGALQLHTDLPYYHFMPGVVLLHCIIQSSQGGENILSDGLNAAQLLSKRDYRILADTIVDWVDIGSQQNFKFYSINRSPVLCEDCFGNLEKINWSQPQRDSMFNVTVQRAIEWYRASKNFTRILHDKENAVSLKTRQGDILTFDNRRILHGRADYVDGRRLLCGGYLDWDELYSRIRILQEEFTPTMEKKE